MCGGKFQRLVGRATSILGIALFVPTVAWLVSQGVGALSFLPKRQLELFIEVGSTRFALSATHLGYLILIISILLIACGKFIKQTRPIKSSSVLIVSLGAATVA